MDTGFVATDNDSRRDKRNYSSQALVDGYASLDRVGAGQIDANVEQAQAQDYKKSSEDHQVHIFDDTIRSSGEKPQFQVVPSQINNNSSEETEKVSGAQTAQASIRMSVEPIKDVNESLDQEGSAEDHGECVIGAGNTTNDRVGEDSKKSEKSLDDAPDVKVEQSLEDEVVDRVDKSKKTSSK